MLPNQLGTWGRYINSGLEEGEVNKKCLGKCRQIQKKVMTSSLFGSKLKVQTENRGRLQVGKYSSIDGKCSTM